MSGEFSYIRYLEAKRSVDDRAINRVVLDALRERLPTGKPLRILEIGGGTGSMVRRCLEWSVLNDAQYDLVDEDAEAIQRLPGLLKTWAEEAGVGDCQQSSTSHLELKWRTGKLAIHLEQADITDYLATCATHYDLVLANAVLDLVDLASLLPRLWAKCRPGALFWFTINFDGESVFLPPLADDELIFEAYHASMDRRTGSRYTGRSLFAALKASGASLVESGSSDWVVHGSESGYRGDEAYFLNHIVHTIDQELAGNVQLPASRFESWVKTRHEQVARGELVYLAHQLDFIGFGPQQGSG
jgi:SAM-dependent methyltransferase